MLFKRNYLLNILLFLLVSVSFGSYEAIKRDGGGLISPLGIIQKNSGKVPSSLIINGHKYGVKHYIDDSRLRLRVLFTDYPVLTSKPYRFSQLGLLKRSLPARNWVQTVVAKDLLGIARLSKVAGYVPTKLPVKKFSDVRKPLVVIKRPTPGSQSIPESNFIKRYRAQGVPSKAPYNVKYVNPGNSFKQSGIDWIVREIGTKLAKEAYVYGMDFSKSEWRIMKHRPEYIKSRTAREFMKNMNRVLKKVYGISHLEIEIGGGRDNDSDDSDDDDSYDSEEDNGDDSEDDDDDRSYRSNRKYQSGRSSKKPFLKWHNVNGKRVPQFILPDLGDGYYSKSIVAKIVQQIKNSPWVIFDLRDNPGGEAENVLDLIKYFLPNGKLFAYGITKEDYVAYKKRTGDPSRNLRELIQGMEKALGKRIWRLTTTPSSKVKIKGNLIVLIDEEIGSGGEVMSDALKIYRKALVIGTKTSGEVLGADEFKISGGFKFDIPTEDYFRIDLSRIEGVGVLPSPGFETSSKAALNKALQYLKKRL